MQLTRAGVWGAAGLFAAIVAFGLVSVWLATRQPSIALGVETLPAIVLLVTTGLALAAAGCAALVVYPGETFGRLAIAASLAWFAAGWASPGGGVSPLFTAGLVLASASAPIVGHAILGYGTSISGRTRALVATGYVACVVVLGLAPAITQASAGDCPACPANLIALVDEPTVGRLAATAGLVLAASWAAMVAIVAGMRVARASTAARRTIAPVAVPGTVAIVAFGIDAARSVPRGSLGVEGIDQALWTVESIALIVLAAGSALRLVRGRRTRDAVAAIVLDLARGSEAGRLQDRLRLLLGDPGLVLAYPAGDGRLVDALGAPAPALDVPGRHTTPLVRDGDVVAVIRHRAGLEHDGDRMSGIAVAAGLALDNERLLAESRARLADIRASRARVVEAGDRERARLEHDLHDGAQQRLAGLALAVRVTRSALLPGGAELAGQTPGPAAAALAEAETEVRAAIADLRDVAHGIYPAVLADMGLGPAAASLAEHGHFAVAIEAMPADRLPVPVEATAYLVLAETPARVGARKARARGEVVDGRLRVRLILDGIEPDRVVDLTDLEDRVGALEGSMTTSMMDLAMVIEVDLPCGS